VKAGYNQSWPEKRKYSPMKSSRRCFLVGAPSTYGPPVVIPPEHSARLIALGYMADIQGRLRMTTPGRMRLADGMLTAPTQAVL
jgi:hypothetical protein